MSPRARWPRRVAAVLPSPARLCVPLAALLIGAVLTGSAAAAPAAFGLVSDVCYPTTTVPAWYTWPQTPNQWMGVAVGPHYPASYSTYLGIYNAEGGSELAHSEIQHQTNLLVRKYSGGGEVMWAKVYAGTSGSYNYSVAWDDGQGTLTLPAHQWKNYGGPAGDCGLIRVWNLALTADHSYAFRLSTSVAGDDVRMVLLLSGGSNGWLGRDSNLFEESAGTDTTATPFTYTAATTGTYAFAVFNNTLATTGGRYKVEVWDLGTAAKPNLVIDHIDPNSAAAGTPVTATVYVRNSGAAGAGASTTSVKLDGVTKCAAVSTPALAAGATTSITCALGTLTAGTRYVQACADVGGVVDEGASGETDNCSTEAIYVGAPDLVVTSLSPTSGSANDPLTVTIYVKNQGGADAGASATRLKFDGVTKCAAISTPALPAGSTTAVTCVVGAWTAGVHSLEATADVNGQVGESDETNNTRTGSVCGFQPDLMVVSMIPDQQPAGTPVTLYIAVQNRGGWATPASKTRVRVDGVTICAQISTPAMDASSQEVVSCDLGVLPVGVHQVEACADITNLVTEEREDNNCRTQPLTITGPDLIVEGVQNTRGAAGQALTVSVTIRNQGSASAAASMTRVKVAGVTKCDAIATPALPSGANTTVTCNIGSYPAGTYTLEAIADATGLVTETNEANNSLTAPVEFKPGVTFIVNAYGTGDYPTIQAAIDAALDGAVIALEDGEYYGPGNRDLDYHGKRITVRSVKGSRVNCRIVAGVTPSDVHRGFYFHTAEDSLATLEDLTVYGGNMAKGGGIYCNNSSPRLVNVEVFRCNATDLGGGMACENYASPIVTDCALTDCDAANQGGGLYCANWSSPRITNTSFSECASGTRGGGAVFSVNCFPILTNCVFGSNSSQNGGGAMFVYAFGPLTNCRFLNNSASYGGGLQCYGNGQCTLVNCSFSGNSASAGGSDLYCRNNSSPSVQKSILAFGSGRPAVERYETTNNNPTFTCCDLYGNPAGDWAGFIAGQLGVSGNISADPLFCNRAGNNLCLSGESPCAPGNNAACGLIGALPVGCHFVRYVRASGTGDYPTIQAAVNAALAGDIVKLADGTYTGTGNRDIDFGGKALTVKSQSGVPDLCVLDLGGIEADPHRAFYFHSGEDSTSVVEGIKIYFGLTSVGGGIYCNNSSPRLRNVSFRSNVSPDDGGHLACVNHASPIVEDCVFLYGSATDQGGAIYCSDWSSPRLTDCAFSHCSAVYRGGAAAFSVNCFPTVMRCTFDHCNANNGGALCYVYAFGPVDSCVFSTNGAIDGGGMQCYGNAQCTIRNCTFVGNSASGSGGGIYCRNNSSPSIANTIIAQSTHGGAVARLESNCFPTLTCCDLWGNTGGDWTGYVAAQYGVSGNVSVDPYFCDAAADNYHLESASYCREGNNPCGTRIGALGSGCTHTVDVPAPEAPPAVSFLGPIVPNPFTARTTVRFGLAQAAPVALDVYDLAGRRVRRLANGESYAAGAHAIEWDARDDAGRTVRAGVYFCRLRAGAYVAVKRMILLR
jgi:predicted outer membrane repeat protein